MNTVINKFFLLACTGLLVASCAKDSPEPQDFSSSLFINASPGTPPLSITVDTADVLSAGNLSSPIVHFGNTTYQGMQPGSHRITFLNQSASGRTVYLDLPSENFEANRAYSYFMYDTLISGRPKILRLNDDIAPPSAGNVRVRVVHLAKSTGPVDVTFIRGTTYTEGSNSTSVFVPSTATGDSVTFTNVNYVGDTPDANALSTFREIAGSTGVNALTATGFTNVPQANRNNRMMIKIKQAGTQTILLQNVAAGLPNTNTLIAGRVYTIYISGQPAKSVATDFRVIQNFQYNF